MIRKTLPTTKEATFAILLPNPNRQNMPTPTGTGFFISSDGWFVTAAHVITENNLPDGPVRNDIEKTWLMKENRSIEESMGFLQAVSFDYIDAITDFALLKVDFQANSNKDFLKGKNSFPYIEVSSRELDEGEQVYSFGYPLSSASHYDAGIVLGWYSLSPRVTSAIVSSRIEATKMVETNSDAKVYLLDKPLNYGNSGGPIMATETGKVHAFCSRFQPVSIPQNHLKDEDGKSLLITIPSLYGVVSSFANPSILHKLNECGIPISAI